MPRMRLSSGSVSLSSKYSSMGVLTYLKKRGKTFSHLPCFLIQPG